MKNDTFKNQNATAVSGGTRSRWKHTFPGKQYLVVGWFQKWRCGAKQLLFISSQ